MTTSLSTELLNKYSGIPLHVPSPDSSVRIQTFKNRTIFTVTDDTREGIAKLGGAKLNGITFPFKFAKGNVFVSTFGIIPMCKKEECAYISMNNNSKVLSTEDVDSILQQDKIPEIISSLSDFVLQCDSPESRVIDPVSCSVVFAVTRPNQNVRPFILTLRGTVFESGQKWDAAADIETMEDGPAKEDAKHMHSLIPSFFWGSAQIYIQCKVGISIVNVLAKTWMVKKMEFDKHMRAFVSQLRDKKLNPQLVAFLTSYVNSAMADQSIVSCSATPLELHINNSIRHSHKRTLEAVASPTSAPQGKAPKLNPRQPGADRPKQQLPAVSRTSWKDPLVCSQLPALPMPPPSQPVQHADSSGDEDEDEDEDEDSDSDSSADELDENDQQVVAASSSSPIQPLIEYIQQRSNYGINVDFIVGTDHNIHAIKSRTIHTQAMLGKMYIEIETCSKDPSMQVMRMMPTLMTITHSIDTTNEILYHVNAIIAGMK